MSLLDDEDDNSSLIPPPNFSSITSPSQTIATASSLPPEAAADDFTTEDLMEEEGAASQDFRAFAASLQSQSKSSSSSHQFRKTAGVSAQTIRKGEKDFESHGLRAQEDALEQSRAAMRDVLSYTRVHSVGQKAGAALVRGWYFPAWWEGYSEVVEEEEEDKREVEGRESQRKPYGHIRERVVVLEGSSPASHSLGRAVTGQAKDRPARGKDWLLPEEALYLVERGSLDLWWPLKGIEEILPPEGVAAGKEGEGEEEADEEDEYEMGFPLSLQAAYALLIGNDGERGKISLQKFQVYSNLKRCGYNVLRAPPVARQPPLPPTTPITTTLWQWFSSLLATSPHHLPYGPLVQPGLYRSYASIYRQMALLPRHKPSTSTQQTASSASEPFTVHFHIWKAAQKWTKLRHPPPDFRLAVFDAQESAVPSLSEISALLAATPPAPGKPEWTGHPGRLYARLKHGHRNVLVAVVDHGVINYMRFAEAALGLEELYARFDAPRGGGRKSGGRGGGRGGRGGGRGRGRGR
jgi:tRNA-splicing endonuclease subunit Sen54